MVRLNPRQREALVETLRELANLAAAALVLGQFVGQQPLSWTVVGGGIVAWATFVAVSVALMGTD